MNDALAVFWIATLASTFFSIGALVFGVLGIDPKPSSVIELLALSAFMTASIAIPVLALT